MKGKYFGIRGNQTCFQFFSVYLYFESVFVCFFVFSTLERGGLIVEGPLWLTVYMYLCFVFVYCIFVFVFIMYVYFQHLVNCRWRGGLICGGSLMAH